jgi:4-alpha-glucanotransferase
VTATTQPIRSAGVLLHPTSLPGPYGIGDLGPVAREWVDVLAAAAQTWWQVLPLGPTGFGDSPYQSFSAFAGNPYLLSPDLLLEDDLLHEDDLAGAEFPTTFVDYGAVIQFKTQLVQTAWDRFQSGRARTLRSAFEAFCAKNKDWLDDYALFMALKDAHDGADWQQWEDGIRLRQPASLGAARRLLADGYCMHRFGQFLFDRQWSALRAYTHEKGLKLIGDVPIFVSTDSADVWANPELFQLDEERRPAVVAGVPPDYFSLTGQLWGNPHYDWQAMQRTGYAWWIARFRATLAQVDLVRLDHFRGFEAYWEVPADAPTAQTGRWVHAPGADLLTAVQTALGGLPLIAEDLGVITPEVEALRDRFGLPGMRILQFAFDKPDNRFLPHHYVRNTVVYTGTHDNDTTVGWFLSLPEHDKWFIDRYAPGARYEIAWGLIRLAWSSVAGYALTPLQDLLSLSTEARMNYPGRPENNWRWRFITGQVTPQLIDRLGDITALYSRERGAAPPANPDHSPAAQKQAALV